MRAAALRDAEPSRVGLILLAAGGSRRLGTPKQLLRDVEASVVELGELFTFVGRKKRSDTVGELLNGSKLLLKLACSQERFGMPRKSGRQFANSIRTFFKRGL